MRTGVGRDGAAAATSGCGGAGCCGIAGTTASCGSIRGGGGGDGADASSLGGGGGAGAGADASSGAAATGGATAAGDAAIDGGAGDSGARAAWLIDPIGPEASRPSRPSRRQYGQRVHEGSNGPCTGQTRADASGEGALGRAAACAPAITTDAPGSNPQTSQRVASDASAAPQTGQAGPPGDAGGGDSPAAAADDTDDNAGVSPSCGSRSPHVPQNLSPARYSALHAGHFIPLPSPARRTLDDAPGSSLYDSGTDVASARALLP